MSVWHIALMGTRAPLVAAAAVASATLAGCTSTTPPPPDASPTGQHVRLSPSSETGEVCVPTGSTDHSYAIEPISNTSDHEVEVVSVRLLGARHVRLAEAFVLPEAARGEMGVLDGWPGEGVSPQTRRALIPIPGATLEPASTVSDEADELALALHLRTRSQGEASFDAVQVVYRTTGSDATYRSEPSSISFRAAESCDETTG